MMLMLIDLVFNHLNRWDVLRLSETCAYAYSRLSEPALWQKRILGTKDVKRDLLLDFQDSPNQVRSPAILPIILSFHSDL